jgi:undecaprenyl-diphosphatase
MFMLYQFDLYLFRLLNNLAGQNRVWDWFFYFAAVYLIFVMVGLAFGLVLYYLTPSISPYFRKAKTGGEKVRVKKIYPFLFLLVATPILAYFLKIIVNLVYFRPRPFVVLSDVHQLIFKSPFEASFPSGHTVIAFALAFAVFYKNKIWGSVFLVLALAVGLGRIFAGVHYPLDIVGGIIVAFLASLSSARISERLFIYGK